MDPRQVLIWSRGPPKGLAGGGLKIGIFFAGQEKAGGPTNKLLLEPELCAIWQMWNPCEKGGKVGKRPGKKAARPGTHWWGSTTIFTFFPCFAFTLHHSFFTEILSESCRDQTTNSMCGQTSPGWKMYFTGVTSGVCLKDDSCVSTIHKGSQVFKAAL